MREPHFLQRDSSSRADTIPPEDAAAEFFRSTLRTSLGRGGVGEVFALGKQRAIKIVFPQTEVEKNITPPEEQQRLAGLLPSSAPIHATGRGPRNEMYLVMERLRGCSIAEISKTLRQLKPEMLNRIAASMAGITQELGEKRINHGDLKPGNCLQTERLLRVVDFDSTRQFLLDSDSIASTNVFTFPYCAPEVLKDGVYTTRSDVYSMGASLFNIAADMTASVSLGIHDKDAAADFYRQPAEKAQTEIDRVIGQHVTDTRLRTMVLDAMRIEPDKRTPPADLRSQIEPHAADPDDLAKALALALPRFAENTRRTA